jgi:GR25 family glycosyltransferase involved in LPS biosynthesis
MLGILLLLLIVIIIISIKKNEPYTDVVKDKAYVINLDDRPDRFDIISKSFEKAPFDIERFSAIKDSVGWKGCGKSHCAIIQMAKDNHMPTVLIMEDDCKPSKNFNESWPLIKNWLDNNKNDWDIYIGGTTYYYIMDKSPDTIKPICKINDSIKLYNTKLLCLHFYYLNSSVYDRFLEWKKDVDKSGPIDLWPDSIHMRIVTSTPFIASQNDSYSNIANSQADYSNAFKDSNKIIASIQNNSACDLNNNS